MCTGCRNGCMRKMKARIGDEGARLKMRGTEQFMVAGLFANDTKYEGILQSIVDVFDMVCKRKKLKVNVYGMEMERALC